MSIRRKGTFQSIFVVLFVPFLCLFLGCGKGEKESEEKEAKTTEAQETQEVQAYGKLPLSFTENRGQVAEPVRFYVRGSRGTIYYTPEEVVYDVVERASQPERRRPGERGPEVASPDTTVRRRGVVVRMKFQGANPSVALEGLDELEGKVNIFRGKDPSQWKTGIRTFGSIVYRELYPGVDLAYQGREGRLAHRLTVSPRGKIEDIAFHYEGAEKIRVDETGALRIETTLGTITEPKVICYQERDGGRVELKGRYQMLDETTVGFAVEKFRKDLPLIISGG